MCVVFCALTLLAGPFAAYAKNPSDSYKIVVRLTYFCGHSSSYGSRVSWCKVSRATPDKTLAADTNIFPYGTEINVPGWGICRVEDTGTDVVRRRASGRRLPVLDMYVASKQRMQHCSNVMPEYVEVIVYPL